MSRRWSIKLLRISTKITLHSQSTVGVVGRLLNRSKLVSFEEHVQQLLTAGGVQPRAVVIEI